MASPLLFASAAITKAAVLSPLLAALPSTSSPAATVVILPPRRAASARRRRAVVVLAIDEGVLSGEWPEYSYADLESRIVASGKMSPTARLMDVMSRPVQVATPGQRLAEVLDAAHHSGLPVVDDEGRCVGIVSTRATNGVESTTTVGEVMSYPAITLTHDKTVLDAAALMLTEKVHRVPVVNEQQHVIGIVTRTDIFQALEANKA